jgi:hypothetical protein
MLMEGGPWAMITLLLSILSLIPSVMSIMKKGDVRYIGLAAGISVTAFSFGLLGTSMGIYEIGRVFADGEIPLQFFARGLGISMIPMLFSCVFLGLNSFLLGVSSLLRT